MSAREIYNLKLKILYQTFTTTFWNFVCAFRRIHILLIICRIRVILRDYSIFVVDKCCWAHSVYSMAQQFSFIPYFLRNLMISWVLIRINEQVKHSLLIFHSLMILWMNNTQFYLYTQFLLLTRGFNIDFCLAINSKE